MGGMLAGKSGLVVIHMGGSPRRMAALCAALRQGADPGRITMSSDAGGSQPIFDSTGECIGLGTTTSATLLQELRRMLFREGLPLETALRFFTENPARVLGQAAERAPSPPARTRIFWC